MGQRVGLLRVQRGLTQRRQESITKRSPLPVGVDEEKVFNPLKRVVAKLAGGLAAPPSSARPVSGCFTKIDNSMGTACNRPTGPLCNLDNSSTSATNPSGVRAGNVRVLAAARSATAWPSAELHRHAANAFRAVIGVKASTVGESDYRRGFVTQMRCDGEVVDCPDGTNRAS